MSKHKLGFHEDNPRAIPLRLLDLFFARKTSPKDIKECPDCKSRLIQHSWGVSGILYHCKSCDKRWRDPKWMRKVEARDRETIKPGDVQSPSRL